MFFKNLNFSGKTIFKIADILMKNLTMLKMTQIY
jgi:hypothetical protein